jgi:hypothetical protein
VRLGVLVLTDSFRRSVPGLRAVFVCDRDGVTLLKCRRQERESVCVCMVHASLTGWCFAATAANETVSDDEDVTLAAAFAISADQVAKVHLGRMRSLATFFSKQLVVHINVLPLVVALIAEPDSNAGVLMSLEQDFSKALATLRASVEQLDKF